MLEDAVNFESGMMLPERPILYISMIVAKKQHGISDIGLQQL